MIVIIPIMANLGIYKNKILSLSLFISLMCGRDEIISKWPNGDTKTIHSYVTTSQKEYLYKIQNFKNNKLHGEYIHYDYEYHHHTGKPINKISKKGKYNNGKKDGFWIEGISQGHYVDDKKDGEWITYRNYERNKIKIKEFYKNGKRNGEYISYQNKWVGGIQINTIYQQGKYNNGKKDGFWIIGDSEGYYINDKKDGQWITYNNYEKNEIKIKEFYKNGKREGEYIAYHREWVDGELLTNQIYKKGKFNNNKRDGQWITYNNYENNEIKIKEFYKNGKREGEYISYQRQWVNGEFLDNQIGEKGKYKNSKKDGFWIDGYSQGNYIEGIKDGQWITYNNYEKNEIKIKEFYKNGKREGEYIHYQLRRINEAQINEIYQKGKYNDGKKDGFWIEPNTEGYYINGQKHGEWIYYNHNNIIQRKEIYVAKKINLYPQSSRNISGQLLKSILINRTLYNKNGVIKEENIYIPTDSLCIYGSINDGTGLLGKKIEYHDNGNIKNESNFIQGGLGYSNKIKHGIQTNYCDNGTLISKIKYNNNRIVGYFYYVDSSLCGDIQKNHINNDKENFNAIKKSLFKSKNVFMYEGFANDKSIFEEATFYYPNDITKKIIISKLKSTPNQENNFQARTYINEDLFEEILFTSIPYLSSIGHWNNHTNLKGSINFIEGNGHSIHNLINFRSKQNLKMYGKNEKLLIEDIYNNNIETRIYYDEDGTENEILNFHPNKNGVFIEYYKNPDHYGYETHDLIHIKGKYKNGKPIGEWIHYGYDSIEYDNINSSQYSMNPNSKKIIFKANVNHEVRNGEWIFSYPIYYQDKLLWHNGSNPNRAMTNTKYLRSSNFYKLKCIVTGNCHPDANYHWGPIPNHEGGDWVGSDESYQPYNIIINGEYKDGLQEGLWVAKGSPGNMILEESKYKDGALNGKMIFYYQNGNKKFEGEWKDGKRIGVWIYYFKNGNIKAKGEVKDESPIGVWTVYNQKGLILKDDEKWRFFR